MQKIINLLVLLSLVSCVTPQICHDFSAFDAGRLQAERGESPRYDVGRICEGDDAQVFRAGFDRGYEQGFRKLCSDAEVQQTSMQLGLDGQTFRIADRFGICQDQNAIRRNSLEAYQKGLSSYCAPEKIGDLAYKAALQTGTADFPRDRYQICTRVQDLAKVWQQHAHKGRADFCKAPDAEQQGFAIGIKNAIFAVSSISSRYTICSKSDINQAEKSFQKGYNQGIRNYCLPSQHQEEITKRALKSAVVSFDPATYGICKERFPDLWVEYEAAFLRSRETLVKDYCSYGRGEEEGRKLARNTHALDGRMPDFCTEGLFTVYFQGLKEGWQTEKHEICHVSAAFEFGRQDALSDIDMHPNPSSSFCPENLAQEYRANYSEGYRNGSKLRHRRGQEQTIQLSNNGGQPVYYAVGFKRWDGWRASGWYEVPGWTTISVTVETDKGGSHLYCHATRGETRWGNGPTFCVRHGDPFTNLDESICGFNVNGYARENFWKAPYQTEAGVYSCSVF